MVTSWSLSLSLNMLLNLLDAAAEDAAVDGFAVCGVGVGVVALAGLGVLDAEEADDAKLDPAVVVAFFARLLKLEREKCPKSSESFPAESFSLS